jgi:hypothetical protein
MSSKRTRSALHTVSPRHARLRHGQYVQKREAYNGKQIRALRQSLRLEEGKKELQDLAEQ